MCTPHAVALAPVPNTHNVRNSLSTGVLRARWETNDCNLRQIQPPAMGVLPHRIGEMPHAIRDGRHKLLNLNPAQGDSLSGNCNFSRAVE
jgi:hypothetical protein